MKNLTDLLLSLDLDNAIDLCEKIATHPKEAATLCSIAMLVGGLGVIGFIFGIAIHQLYKKHIRKSDAPIE